MSKFQLLVGSVMGTAEMTAEAVANDLRGKGHEVDINKQPQAADLVRDADEILLICTSNTGSGDLPDNIRPLYQQMVTEYPAIAGRRYGVINLGDSCYDTYNDAGRLLDDTFEDLGAVRVGNPLVLDASSGQDPEEGALLWLNAWMQKL
ncbi:flavodoxin domain-containing protein [Marinimicrobium alkaliphilum]|uniref:flavodoxin domain-containing protein n=1 Tax=Marinimicrobium alkaliphilum TaxID=2202654 RepID=UPI000DB95402|nr:flavodoxin domain-containing protein [Marinimicrobium alkaliphilum]